MSHQRLAAALLAISLAACSDSGTTSASSGSLTLQLTDAPANFKHAVVTISQIYLQPGNDSTAQRVVLSNTPVTTDLLTLSNDVSKLVDNAVVPAGTYNQLRFVITGGYVEVATATGSEIYATSSNYAGLPSGAIVTGTLQMPSYAQSGLKVNLPGGGITIGTDAKILLVDFNVQKSFGQQAGASGRWVMSPVVNATDFQATGSLTATMKLDSGVVLPQVGGTTASLANARAVLIAADSTQKALSFVADTGGTFKAKFKYVVPGTYQLDVVLDSTTVTTNPAHPATVTVSSAQAATQNFRVTNVTKP